METPEYIFEEAAKVAYENITPQLREKFSMNDILEILLVEDEFFDSIEIDGDENAAEDAIEIDDHEMITYILTHCATKKIILTPLELEEILDGEYLYLEQKGLIDSEE